MAWCTNIPIPPETTLVKLCADISDYKFVFMPEVGYRDDDQQI